VGEEERAAFAYAGLHPYRAAIHLDRLLDNGQTHARRVNLVAWLAGLEYLEGPLKVLRLDARPVVGDVETPAFAVIDAADPDESVGLVVVLDGVAEEVLEYLLDARTLGRDGSSGISICTLMWAG
jgi:hypothetical protein